MATLVLSGVGAAIGGGFGGTILGMSGAVIGRAIGATLGRMIDQRLVGAGSGVVQMGRVDRFRLMGAGEGQPITRVWGRMRVGGHVIWASGFEERSSRQRSGKGMSRGPTTETFSYVVSLAVALCEGEILRLGRIWADGVEIDPEGLALRVYPGSADQMPDAKIEAVEGAGRVPAYRGIAYVVIEDLDLGRFGNRVPQFSFEVVRAAKAPEPGLQQVVRAVALIPGTGEYSLATSPVTEIHGPGEGKRLNASAASSLSDMDLALEQLTGELPACRAVSLVVSWFGDDLRCGFCQLRPRVEQTAFDGDPMPWRAGGIGRGAAGTVPRADGRPVYGGTPADGAVREAIAALRAAGQEVMFYPFILMEQMAGNGLADPWSGAEDQPVLPWRGRLTLSVAPGRPGSPDRSAAAEAEVARFFGAAQRADFVRDGEEVAYVGDPEDWGYRRFILHYAHLCAAAGGVDAFCVGSELRGLTAIRGAGDSFPAVAALRGLLGDLRAILGPECKLSYAADWSEYAGYTSPEGDRYFHLDPLWADPEVDFIGIDNYMPLSDWRHEAGHRDADWGQLHGLDYLCANVAGGEYFDWYYEDAEGAAAQRRVPISDGAYDEPWIWRLKDLEGWWHHPHHERLGGARAAEATAWVPQSKPFWFTEIGCAAIDLGTNQPNLFLDPKSSESFLPRGSTGRRDDYLQMQYLRALDRYWGEGAHNPVSALYPRRMVDLDHAFVWAWDARPFPHFPGRLDKWSDGENYARGHWLSGRASNQSLASVIWEICAASGLAAVDVSQVHGVVRGLVLSDGETARAALQGLMMAHGVEVVERGGQLCFFMRGAGAVQAVLAPGELAIPPEGEAGPELVRAAEAEVVGRLRLAYTEAEGDFEQRLEEASCGDEALSGVADMALGQLLTPGEARAMAERWLIEARVARDSLRLALPPSRSWLGAGDLIALEGAGRFRIDRVEEEGVVLVEALRSEPLVYQPSDQSELRVVPRRIEAAGPLLALFLDLPLMQEGQEPGAPFLAISARPWLGPVAVWSAEEDAGYELNTLVAAPAEIGVTQTALQAAPSGRWDRGAALRVRMLRGTLSSASAERVFNGANALAIGDGSSGAWEIMQFCEAVPVGEGEWDLRLRLRGQLGSDAMMPQVWPAGSFIVVLDRDLPQIRHPAARRGLERHYRIGLAEKGPGDAAACHQIEGFEGVALRPLSPVHLRMRHEAEGMRFRWIRRGRVEADSWIGPEIALGEEREAYRLRLWQGDQLRRTWEVTSPEWLYSEAERLADGLVGGWRLDVAQFSDRYGAGPVTWLDMGLT